MNYAGTYNSSLPTGFKILLALIIGLILSITIQLSFHARSHGDSSDTVRDCFIRGQIMGVWRSDINPDRIIHICYVSEGRVGIYIIERMGNIYKEVTSFIKRCSDPEKLYEYLIRSGNHPVP